jgi:cell division protein ZapA (FtsZ GTPase activity inhibitor)
MLEEKIKIDNKEYTVSSADWDGEILREAVAQLERGILFYKQTKKDEISAVVLAALAFAYDSVSKSKNSSNMQNSISTQAEEQLQNIVQKITKYIQTPLDYGVEQKG